MDHSNKKPNKSLLCELNPDDSVDKTSYFLADLFDVPVIRSDLASMDLPIFALQTGVIEPIVYQSKDGETEIYIEIGAANKMGRATVHDRDLWLFFISKLAQAKFEGAPIDRRIRFTAADYLKVTQRDEGGSQYEQLKQALMRLSGTWMRTDIKTGKLKSAAGFSMLSEFKIQGKKAETPEEVKAYAVLPDWLFRSVLSGELKRIDDRYFKLRKTIERSLYLIACKHTGHQGVWRTSLEKLKERVGSRRDLRLFKHDLKAIAAKGPLIDFQLSIDDNIVTFKTITGIKKADVPLLAAKKPHSPKNEVPTSEDIARLKKLIHERYGHKVPRYSILDTDILDDKRLRSYLSNFSEDQFLTAFSYCLDLDFSKSGIKDPAAYFYGILRKKFSEDE